MNFHGKTAIVTGADLGIGKTTALRLAKAGANVAAIDIDKTKVEQTVEAIRASGSTAIALTVDITNILSSKRQQPTISMSSDKLIFWTNVPADELRAGSHYCQNWTT